MSTDNQEREIDIISLVTSAAVSNSTSESRSKITSIYGPGYLEELDAMDDRWNQREEDRKRKCTEAGQPYIKKAPPARDRDIPDYDEGSEQKVFLVPKGQLIRATPESGKSLLFYGLRGSYITIYSKANKVTISKCEDVRIHLLGGTVSGVEVIRCRRVYIEVPYVNYANLELADTANLFGGVDGNTKITCSGCMDVILNGTKSRANMFNRISMDGDLNVGSIHPSGWPNEGGLDPVDSGHRSELNATIKVD